MLFSISFDKVVREKSELSGIIKIDQFSESFRSSVTFWAKADYESQWREALSRLLAGAGSSCLLTSVSRPESANFFEWWPMYRTDENIEFQNGLLFLDRLPEKFSFPRIYDYVTASDLQSNDNPDVSRWYTSISAIEKFLRTSVS
jgi:hypothetical protein